MHKKSPFCLGCRSKSVLVILDFGPQPPSNRYVRLGETNHEVHDLRLAQCLDCGLVQLEDPMPIEMVKSHFDWITYNEPEGHLDDLVEHLSCLPLLSTDSRIMGLSYKDDSTLARFNRLGYSNTFRLNVRKDLLISDNRAGIESIQSVVDEGLMRVLAERHGQADLLIVRHVLEHAHDPGRFIRAFRPMLRPGAHVVFEVPDCRNFISACDYSFVWEEHVTYFSPATFSTFAKRNGYSSLSLLEYPYTLENSLVAILSPEVPVAPVEFSAEADLQAGQKFRQAFANRRRVTREYLEHLRSQGQRIVVFGAGHLAAKFLNIFDLNQIVECVIDDNPNKQGLLMPGSNLPIVGSFKLSEGEVDLCLLSLSTESEKKVMTLNPHSVNSRVRFASIFELSSLALRLG